MGLAVAEALDYPDFSVVVTYGRLVIGCAFMTPGAYISYVVVHPDWRGAGIASEFKTIVNDYIEKRFGRVSA